MQAGSLDWLALPICFFGPLTNVSPFLSSPCPSKPVSFSVCLVDFSAHFSLCLFHSAYSLRALQSTPGVSGGVSTFKAEYHTVYMCQHTGNGHILC